MELKELAKDFDLKAVKAWSNTPPHQKLRLTFYILKQLKPNLTNLQILILSQDLIQGKYPSAKEKNGHDKGRKDQSKANQ